MSSLKSLIIKMALVLSLCLPFTAAQAEMLLENGMHSEEWFAHDSFLDLADDYEVAKEEGKQLLVLVEQVGCIYCERLHTEVLTDPIIAQYIQDNFRVVQLDMWGPRVVTDFDGEELSEKDLAQKWRANYTPGIFFFAPDIDLEQSKGGGEIYVHRMDGLFGKITFMSTFMWVRDGAYKEEPLQRYLMNNLEKTREFLKAAS